MLAKCKCKERHHPQPTPPPQQLRSMSHVCKCKERHHPQPTPPHHPSSCVACHMCASAKNVIIPNPPHPTNSGICFLGKYTGATARYQQLTWHLKITTGKGDRYWKPPFLGAMLASGRVYILASYQYSMEISFRMGHWILMHCMHVNAQQQS